MFAYACIKKDGVFSSIQLKHAAWVDSGLGDLLQEAIEYLL
jgi:hypothetical protein